MKIWFIKCHGSGNNFSLIDERKLNNRLSDFNLSEMAKAFTTREGIIGCDGVLFASESKIAEIKMRVFNPDGCETPMCVNGIRCVGRYILEETNKEYASIETNIGVITVRKVEKLFEGVQGFLVDEIMPIDTRNACIPIVFPKDILDDEVIEQISMSYKFSGISVHTPHLVAIVDKINENQLVKIGEKANNDKMIFPNGMNVSFCKKIDDLNIYVRTYERSGIGLSMSCSSAMIASVFIMCKKNQLKFNNWVNVYNKGGMVKLCCTNGEEYQGKAQLIGNATFVYTGNIDYDLNLGRFVQNNSASSFAGSMNLPEVSSYHNYYLYTKQQCNEGYFIEESTLINSD